MPAAPSGSSPLAAEQAYLDRCRRELARMREKTLSMKAVGGDPISAEFLAETLHRRAESLIDDPTTTLFFGRVDIEPERWYVGRRHVNDEAGDPLVIDWRADLSAAFYRASRTHPMGVGLRRRFGVDHGRLTAYEDEQLLDPHPAAGPGGASRILMAEIERPRVGPMRDIVATIQPEQDEIVRADVGTTVCVQGAPGTGKTAVGLHRAAWLLYAYREKLSRTGVLVVGPNRAFLDHVGAVLPALGEIEVRHTTVEELVASVPVRASDSVAAAVLKGDARLATVLRRAVWARVGPVTEPLVVPRGAHRWRVPAYEVEEVLGELQARDIRYGAARSVLPQRLAHHVLLAMERSGDSPDDRVQDSVARSSAMKSYVSSVWPAVDPRQVLFELWSDREALAQCADGVLTEEEQAILVWDKPVRTKGAARWTVADTALLDELADICERTPSLGHVVLDEAQDLSPMQLRAVGRRCSTGSATVLGDIAQGTTPWATGSWSESLTHLGKPAGHVEVLDRGFRVPAAVIDFAARLLPLMAPGLGAPISVRDNPGRLDMVRADVATGVPGLVARVAEVVDEVRAQPGSVGVIVPDALVAEVSAALRDRGVGHGVLGVDHGDVAHQVDVVPAPVAKGLEFDHVVVVEPAAIADAEPDERTGLRRLYVVLTRAVTGLTIVHARDLPTPLT